MKRNNPNSGRWKINWICGMIAVVVMMQTDFLSAQKLKDTGLPPAAGQYLYPDSRLNLLHFRENNSLDAKTLFTSHKDLVGLGENDEMKLTRDEEGTAAIHHYRFQQYYKGIPVEHVSYSLHEKDGILKTGLGKIVRGLEMDVQPKVSASEVIKVALAAVPATSYYWNDPQREQRLKERKHDPTASYFPKPELMMAKADPTLDFSPENYKLMYRVPVMALQPHQPMMVYVDANSGQVIRKVSTELKCSPGSASTTFNGVKTIYTHNTGSTFESVDDCIYSVIYSYNENGDEMTDADNNWTNNSTVKQMAISSLWAVREATNYYATVHDLIGFDGEGDNVEIYNNMTYEDQPCQGCNSSWEWWSDNMNIGYGNTHTSSLDDYNTIDICGHELTHGVIEESTDIDYDGESGAINESFADVFGNLIEYWEENPTDTSWWGIAEDRSGPDIEGNGFRNMADPKEDNQPDTYHGTHWEYNTDDNNDYVHTNSGVGNYAFYLMSEGGSGENDNGDLYNVQGITHATARFIAFDAMYYYADGDPSYEDIRDAWISAANLLYGGCSQEAITTGNAWYAVGVGKYDGDYAASLCGTFGEFVPEYINAIGEIRNHPYDPINHSWLPDPCTAVIETSAPVTAHTSQFIRLEPGFQAKAGCDFSAYIDACDITALKLAADENNLTSDPAVEQKEKKTVAATLFPNPAAAYTTLSFDKESGMETVVTLRDLRGVIVFTRVINDGMEKVTMQINTSDLPKGIYYCLVESNTGTETLQLVVQ